MKCNGCGHVDHNGGCDLVEFYHYQRWARPMERAEIVGKETPPPAPPEGLIDAKGGGHEGTTPLPSQSDISALLVYHAQLPSVTSDLPSLELPAGHRLSKRKKAKSKLKPADSPEMIKRREEIHAARIKNMAYARKVKAEKNADA